MRKPKAFITGIAGFAGTYLAEYLFESGYQVTGSIYKKENKDNLKRIKSLADTVRLDITNQKKVAEVIKAQKPDYIFHLAAFSSVGRSFDNERLVHKINFNGTLNLLTAARELKNLKRFLFVSSSECYGRFPKKALPLSEDVPLNPISPYAISKVASEHTCQLYFERYGMPVSIARAFNHSGPGQDPLFVIPAFARKIALIEKGLEKPELVIGNMKIKRDLADVRDIARGYQLIAEKAKPGRLYQLCSGEAVSIKTLVETFLKLTDHKIKIKIDPSFARKNDIPVVHGSIARIKRELGYKVNYSLKDTLKDTLDYFRARV